MRIAKMHSGYEWQKFAKKYEIRFMFAYQAVIIIGIFSAKMKENAISI